MIRTVNGSIAVFCVFSLTLGLATPLAQAKKLVPVETELAASAGLSVLVRNDIGAVADAEIWIETRDGKLLTAARSGPDGRLTAEVSNTQLADGVSVTAFAPGYAAVSVIDNVASNVTIELSSPPTDAYATLSGNLKGFAQPEDETLASVGLVAKALELADIVQLDVSAFASPLKDRIDVFGPRDVPSNLILPDQNFPVYFMSVQVSKPTYRLPVPIGSSKTYFGISGTLDAQQAIGAIRSGDNWALLDMFEFNKAGVSSAVTAPQKKGQPFKLDLSQDVSIRQTLRLKAPRRATAESDTKRLVVALWEASPGAFVPTDVKLVSDDDLRLGTPVGKEAAKALDVLVSETGNRFRGTWVKDAKQPLPNAALTAELDLNGLDGVWTVGGGESANLMTARVEKQKTSSINGNRHEEAWVIVGPRKAQLRLPAAALHALEPKLGTISHVSVDLLQVGSGGYPVINGATSLLSIEKVRKQIRP